MSHDFFSGKNNSLSDIKQYKKYGVALHLEDYFEIYYYSY